MTAWIGCKLRFHGPFNTIIIDYFSCTSIRRYKMKGNKTCLVCQKVNSSYKCPKCLSPYCCSGCWATHKESCPALQTVAAKTDEEDTTNNEIKVTNNTDNNNSSSPNNKIEMQKEVADNIAILLPAQREALQKSAALQKLLKSKRLRDDISCIDLSSDRQKTLKSMRTKNPEFNAFVETLLQCIKS